jgi:signal transduction histidine kinase
MTIHPGTMTLRAAAQCAFRIMRVGADGIPEEAIAQALAEYFYDHFRLTDTGAPALLLARVSLIESFSRVTSTIQAKLRERHPAIEDQTQCCVLSGSCGQYMEWCRIGTSAMEHCLVVDDAEFVAVRPVVAEVLRGLDRNLAEVGRWEGAGLLEDLDRVVHVVHIEEAKGHPLLQRQGQFVAQYDVRSMIGLGGRLPSGRSVCVELFSSVAVGPERLSHYRVLALSVYLAFLRADLMTIAEQARAGPTNAQAVVLQHVLTAKMQGQERILALYERGAVDPASLASVNAAELRYLLNRLLLTEDLHRRQLSLDLHDEVTSKLGSVIFGMGSLLASPPAEPQDMLDQMARFREELVRLATWTRSKAHELHPAVLTHLGFVDALKRLAVEYGHRMGVNMAVHVTGTIPPDQDPIISTTLYRVVQEALRNIEKHARASQVVIFLRRDGEALHVTIEDNGIGFAREGASREVRGIGLLGMEERVRMINGTFTICSRVGEGTKLELVVPAQLLYAKY